MSLFEQFIAAASITGPVIIILLLGYLLKKIRLVNQAFVAGGNKLIFNVSLPCFLFLSIATGSLKQGLNLPLILFAITATITSVVVIWYYAKWFFEPEKIAVFTQCAFRGNMAIISLALCVSAFGPEVITLAATYLAALTVLYNILAVVLLSRGRLSIISNILKNPLIIAILLGLLFSASQLPLPGFVQNSLKYLSNMTLPLALICIGASLDWQSFKSNQKAAFHATTIKLVFQPALILIVAILVGFRGDALGVLFFMLASPTAAAAYIMSKQMSNQGNLAAEIITLSTSLCPISLTLGLTLLRYFQLV